MWHGSEIQRQVMAGITGGVAFALVYLGLHLVWWVGLIAGLAVYAAALLLIEAELPSATLPLPAQRFNPTEAVRLCEEAAVKLRRASQASHIDADTALALERLAQLVEEIGRNHLQEGRDLRQSRGFVGHYLPKIMAVVTSYVALSERTISAQSQERLQQIATVIRSYLPHVQSIHEACLENDFEKLELETAVLGDVMRLEHPAIQELAL